MKTYHITFIRTRESALYELPLHYTATVRAKSDKQAIDKAKGKMRTELLGKSGYLMDWYKIVPVSEDRVGVRRFIDKNPLDNVEYIRATADHYHRNVKLTPLTAGTLRKLLSGKEGKVTRYRSAGRSGLSVEEIRYDRETGVVSHVTHDLIVRNGGVE